MLEQIATHLLAMMAGGTVGVLAMALLQASGGEFGRFANEHAWKLGRECLLRQPDGQWEPMRVVAVSHRGRLALRPSGDASGRHARWIDADKACDPAAVSFGEED